MSIALNSIYFYNKNCNLRCRHCWIDPQFNDVIQGELRFEEVKDIFLQGKALGMSGVKLSGGEPLLFSYIKPLIRFLGKEKIKIILETNGTLLNDDIAADLKEAGAFVSVSLDGSTEEIHNLLRLSGNSFQKALQGISYLKNNGIEPQIIFSIHRKNQQNLPEMIAFAKSLGARSLKINLIRGVGRAKNIEEDDDLTSTADFISLYKAYKDESANDFRVLFDIPAAFKSITDINVNGCNTCGIKGILGVLSDGNISICGIGNLKEELRFGNIRNTSLAEIWEKTEILRFIRKSIPAKLGGICGRCLIKGTCMGKCIANTYYTTGSFTSGNLFCEEVYQLGLFPQQRLL
jgi:SynChlorMet cassette radical SAM/SPASM protein ScmF